MEAEKQEYSFLKEYEGKKVALFSDLSGLGRCSLVASISVLCAMGVSPCPAPTAILSAQTGFSDYYMDDYTKGARLIGESWIKNGVVFDGIYTGFMTGARQIEELIPVIKELKAQNQNCFLLTDPVCGDGGSPFPFADSSMLEQFRRLASMADVITPNETELCLLEGEEAGREMLHILAEEKKGRKNSQPAISEKIRMLGKIADSISARCDFSQTVLVTGVKDESRGEILNLICRPGEEAEVCASPYRKGSFSGTGDLLASAVAASLAVSGDIKEGVTAAGNMIAAAVSDSLKRGTPAGEGVCYEPYLYMLR